VEQLDPLRPLHEGLVYRLAEEYATHRHAAVGEPLGEGDHVGPHAELLRRECRARAAEAGDHFVEDEQDSMSIADLAQPLQVAARRKEHAGRAGNGLDDDRGDVGGIVQHHQPLELVGKLCPVLGQAA
jgi:hypothetical protein